MKGFFLILGLFILVLVGCSKTPEHVINENDMASLMADMYKAEAMVEEESGKSYNDSMKLVIRQSVFMKHNVTQAQFDTSLIWYAHHLDVYDKVYDDVVKQLSGELQELSKGDFTTISSGVNSDIKPSVPRYRTVGDTADIWGKSRTWMLLPGFAQNIITFDRKPDKESMKGDKYELAFKLENPRQSMKVFIGVDYKDGSTSYIYRNTNNNGWKHYRLQSDSTREVTRIYGYLSYKSKPTHTVFVDSVELLRTHLDRNTYVGTMAQQKWIGTKEKKEDNDKFKKLKSSVKSKKIELNNKKVENVKPAKKRFGKQIKIEKDSKIVKKN